MRTKKPVMSIVTIVVSALLVFTGVGAANATVVAVGPSYIEPGELYTYGTWRYHSTGPARFTMTLMPGCGGYLALGLRYQATGAQTTNSPQWTSTGITKSFLNPSAPPALQTTITGGYYAFNARLVGNYCTGYYWGGTLDWT